MKLTRKSVFRLGIASQIFQNQTQVDDNLPADKKGLNVNVTARMFIRKNAKEIAEMFEMIKEEEKTLTEKHHGYLIQGFGYTQFFENKEQLKSFQGKEEAFNKELVSLKEMGNGLAKDVNKATIKKIEDDFNALKAKYNKPGDAEKAKKNLDKYNAAFETFLNDEEGAMDFKVQPIKAIWFENTTSLPQAFIENYDEAGLINYDI